jgi:hypothetical protein
VRFLVFLYHLLRFSSFHRAQGFTAELGVVIADLEVDGNRLGPHPFFVRLRGDDGKLLEGIRVEVGGSWWRKWLGSIPRRRQEIRGKSLYRKQTILPGKFYVVFWLLVVPRPVSSLGRRTWAPRP